MLDFTSVLYLDMHHPHDALRPWRHLTTGRPAALQSPAAAQRIGRQVADLVGCEAALPGPSSLHLFWDLFDTLATDPITVHVDGGTYPIARWGVERAVGKGVAAMTFAKHDPIALRTGLARAAGRTRPVVLTDGLCPLTGHLAPLLEYAELVRRRAGLLVIDDTQGFGLMGRTPSPARPYGADGAGTPAWLGLHGPDLIIVSSLAKAFGAPLAVISGSQPVIETFATRSETRVHCSPPSMASLRAAEAALALNLAEGPTRRARLLARVRSFRMGLRAIGLSAYGGLFPFQTLRAVAGHDALALHTRLLRRGVNAVLHRRATASEALISFVITARHTASAIAEALQALQECCSVHGKTVSIVSI